MLPSLDSVVSRASAWRRASWPVKAAQGLLAFVVAFFAWPLALGVGYMIVVRSRLQSQKTSYALVTAMVVSCLVAQGAWLQWMSTGFDSGRAVADVNQGASGQTSSSGEVAGVSETNHSNSTIDAQVMRVINGSSLEVTIQDQVYQVQLIGLTAPDPGTSSTPPACYGLESKNYLQGLVGNGHIQLATDEQLPDRNEFGVMLRYAVAGDGSIMNRQILDAGMATESGGDGYTQKVSFLGAQEAAKSAKRGLWGTCNPEATTSPTPTPTSTPTPSPTVSEAIQKAIQPIAPTPTQNATPVSTPLPTPTPTPTLAPTPTETPTPSP